MQMHWDGFSARSRIKATVGMEMGKSVHFYLRPLFTFGKHNISNDSVDIIQLS